MEFDSYDKISNKRYEYCKLCHKACYKMTFRNRKKSMTNFTDFFLRHTNAQSFFCRSFDHVRSVFERRFFKGFSREFKNTYNNLK